MLLGDRKLAILRTIIDDYIVTAEPIGSRTIAKKYNNEISSATIRNEMADLEEMGYLQQLHTSSGRIPSDKAYRFYVDKLMSVKALSKKEADYIKEVYQHRSNQLEDLLMLTTKTISEISNYTAVAVGPRMESVKIRHIRLIPVDANIILVVVVTNSGVVKDMLLRVPHPVEEEYLERVSEILNGYFKNKSLSQMKGTSPDMIQAVIAHDKDFFYSLVDAISETVEGEDDRRVYMEGVHNILDIPEYSDIVKAREFFSLMKKKELMFDLLDNQTPQRGLSIHIGEENPIEEMKSYSVITATYFVNENVYGSVGIIGPKRMNYPKMVSLIDNVVDHLTQHMMNLADGQQANSGKDDEE